MAGRWADAAFEQERLLGTLKYNPNMRDYIVDFQEHAYESMFPEGFMLRVHEQLLQEADPMYVSVEVEELWDYWRHSFKPEPLHPWDLPLNTCFALLPQPLLMRDAENHVISFRAISWIIANIGRNRPLEEWDEDNHPEGLWYTLWSHIDDGGDSFRRNETDMPEREAWEALGQWAILFSGYLPFGMLDDYAAVGIKDAPDNAGIDDIDAAIRVRQDTWLMLQSFWRLARQVVPAREPLPRQLRRDRIRHDRSQDVTVIRLRRAVQDLPEDHEPAYRVGEDFHYINRGGWRNQYYPSLGECYLDDGTPNPESHRQIMVMPFLKGNLDAPLKQPKRAFEFVR